MKTSTSTKIEWRFGSSNIKSERDFHWLDECLVDGVHRFNMFCTKNPVWIFVECVETKEQFRLPLGTIGEGIRLVEKILKEERNKKNEQ